MTSEFSEIELRRLDLNLLLVFAALMRERSVVRAAGRLFLGPSAVSMALARLRAALGDPLLVRAGQAMDPTPRALALWAEVAPALARVEAAVRSSRRFDPAEADLVIRFGAPDDLEFVLIPALLERLAEVAPKLRLVVRPSDFRTLVERLDSGDADLMLSAMPRSGLERRHRVRVLHAERFAALFDPAMLGIDGAPLPMDVYRAVPHLLLSVAGDLHGPLDDALAALGCQRRVLAALAHFPTMPFILKRRRCLANVPATAARHFAAAYGLTLAELPLPSPTFEVALAWHARTDADPAQVWFREVVAALVAEVHAGTDRPGPPRA